MCEEKPRDLLAFARKLSQQKARLERQSRQSSLNSSKNSVSEGSPFDVSFSPKVSDIMCSEVGSAAGEFPRFFTNSFEGTPRSETKDNRLWAESPKNSPVRALKKSLIKVKTKLSNDELQVNQYLLQEQIGVGGFGVVFAAKNTETGEMCAVKVFNKNLFSKKFHPKSKAALNELKNEVETLSSLKHPNIIDVYEVIEGPDSNKVFLVLELATHGSTMELSPMSLDDAARYFRELVLALYYLHEEARYVHRDIKPHNLLISQDFALKLSDFGTAQRVLYGDELSGLAGTHAFMAPEMLYPNLPFAGKPVDMWAAGLTLYYFIHGCIPFKARKIPQLYEQIKTESIVIANSLEPDLQDLLRRLLDRDPCRRLTVREAISHPWIAKSSSL
jgi:[calcium/calmodulin-dependent protein kinase] kinase